MSLSKHVLEEFRYLGMKDKDWIEKRVGIIMEDNRSENDAIEALRNQTSIYEAEEFEEDFDIYMNDFDCDEEQKEEYWQMIKTKKPLSGWGFVKKDGKEYFIHYAW